MEEATKPISVALVTGATGLLGSHIAHKLRQAGKSVRAVCRPGSDISFLKSIGVEVVPGDLTNADSLHNACRDVSHVIHAGAKVGDWGPWKDFVAITIDGTRHLLDAAQSAGVERFIHISSISAYGHVTGSQTVLDERAPLGVQLSKYSYYSRAKVAAEHLVWEAHRSEQLSVTVIRPSWIYGERDRASLARLIDSIRKRKCKLVGDGSNKLNLVYAGNVAEAVILAAEHPAAVGEAFNCSSDGDITQRQYFNMVAESLGCPPVSKSVPVAVAATAAYLLETIGRLTRAKKPPFITRYALWILARRCFFDCTKIQKQLGWSPTVPYEEGVPRVVRFQVEGGAANPPTSSESVSKDGKQEPIAV